MTNFIRVLAKDKTVETGSQSQQMVIARISAKLPEIGDGIPDEIVWMPAGTHEISAHSLDNPDGFQGDVVVDAESAKYIQSSFEKFTAEGNRFWLDRNHDDDQAVAWVKGFRWDDTRGIIAKVEWTDLGKQILTQKLYYSFSPAFMLHPQTHQVVSLIPGHAAGGLVNAPAFGTAMPALVAASKKLKIHAEIETKKTPMNIKEMLIAKLAELGITAPADADEAALLNMLFEAVASSKKPDAEIAEIKASLKTIKASYEAQLKKAEDARVEGLVNEAIKAGKVKPEEKGKWIKVAATAEGLEIMNALPVQASAQNQNAAAEIPASIIQARASIHTTRLGIGDAVKVYASQKNPRISDELLRRDILPVLAQKDFHFGRELGHLRTVLGANSFGTLAPSLIAQTALSQLKNVFPWLFNGLITTDLSAESAAYNQEIIIPIPVRTGRGGQPYVKGVGYAMNDAKTVDATARMNNHNGYGISIDTETLASTTRNTFGEQTEMVHNGLATDLASAILALLIAPTQANADCIATYGFTNESVYAASALNKAAMNTIAGKMRKRGASIRQFMLLGNDAFVNLSNDTTIVNLGVYKDSSLIEEFRLPNIAGFQPFYADGLDNEQAGLFPSDLVAFAGSAGSLVMATRTPGDYSTVLPGAGNGSVSTITNPDTGISVLQAQYVDNNAATATSRIALMFGVGRGIDAAGERIVATATESSS